MRQFDFNAPDFAAAFQAFLDERRGSPADVDEAVAGILAQVRKDGLDAVLTFAERFDKVKLDADSLRVTAEEIAQGVADTAPEVLDALTFAAKRIRAYHERQRPADQQFTDEAGVDRIAMITPPGRRCPQRHRACAWRR